MIRKDRVCVELYTEELLVASEDTANELGVFTSRHKPHLSSNRAYGNKAVERGVFGAKRISHDRELFGESSPSRS